MIYTARYAHLNKIFVKKGDLVTPKLPWHRAIRIGEMGNTGKSTGAHVHIDVICGLRKTLWSLADMANNNPKPCKEQLDFFMDETLFDYPLVKTTDWLGYKNHYAYDAVPKDRHVTDAHYFINWNRSFAGRVVATGTDRYYGNYVLVAYDILNYV